MKNLLITAAVAGMLATPAFAADTSTDTSASTTTNTTTGVTTSQDSGISLSGKAKVLPHASISTGDNTADTDVRTDVDASTTAKTDMDTTDNKTKISGDVAVGSDNDYHRNSGKGHKYGHDKR